MNFSTAAISDIISTSTIKLVDSTISIQYISIDNRHFTPPSQTLFFGFDGHRIQSISLLPELIAQGYKNFVLHEKYTSNANFNANIWFVKNVTEAIQSMASYKRHQMQLKTIAITGSNGKTIVKEWLAQLLAPTISVVKSPKSYNSQIGVALSLWGISDHHKLGIFEAGISKKNEMITLQKLIAPNIGILTNLGEAHNLGFDNKLEKLKEKLVLFKDCEAIIFNHNDLWLSENIVSILTRMNSSINYIGWGDRNDAKIKIKRTSNILDITYQAKKYKLKILSTEPTYVENLSHCIATILYLGYSLDQIAPKIEELKQLEMRLEVLQGINDTILINDTYNSDLNSLKIACDFLIQQAGHQSKGIILSEIFESNLTLEQLNSRIIEIITPLQLTHLILVGKGTEWLYDQCLLLLECSVYHFFSTEAFLAQFDHKILANEVLLIKGSRAFRFETIIAKLQKKTHETFLQIHLNAIKQNLNLYAAQVKHNTKIMIMLKAQGYGLGSIEIAKMLEHYRADYFAVAYADEGIELRLKGVQTPIMIMNPELNAIEKIYKHHLEPEIYSISFLTKWIVKTKSLGLDSLGIMPIHLKLETGMNRLGIDPSEISSLLELILQNPFIYVQSVFTHLVGSEDTSLDDFTTLQYKRFDTIYSDIESTLGYKPLRHILNSEGIIRHPQFQLDMVRLGIGLYGISGQEKMCHSLVPTVYLYAKIAQIKFVSKNETIGYSKKGILSRDSIIGVVNIGYSDGYSRRLGNGKANVWIKGQYFPTIGNICMDMLMIDITDAKDIYENDEVELLGNHITIHYLAHQAETIPYEILTALSSRIQRIYYED